MADVSLNSYIFKVVVKMTDVGDSLIHSRRKVVMKS